MATQSTRADYLITGGLVVSGKGISRQDILVSGETVQEMAPDLPREAAARTIDAFGKYVLPGIIDAHNHPVNADRMDDFSISAAFGGVTTVIPFIGNVRTWGIQGTTTDVIKTFIEESERISYLDFSVHAVLMGEDDVEELVPQLIDMGVISFKMFMTYPRRGMMMPDGKMLQAMALAADRGGLAMVHAENGYCIDYLVDRFTAQGKTSPEYYAPSQPNILEVEAANRAATYAAVTGCPLYIVHLSAREIGEMLHRFKGQGHRIYGETCPQYLALTNQAVLNYGALAKIGPPLREAEDNEAIWKAVASHAIDTIGSDSVGLTKETKLTSPQVPTPQSERGDSGELTSIFDARFGGNWVEEMLPVVYEEGVNRGRITLCRLVQVMCENPAKIFGLYPKKGILQPGSDADLILFDPAIRHTLGAQAQHSKSDYTIFEGKEVLGKPVFSMQRGQVIIENSQMKRPQGRARFYPGDRELAAYAPKGYAAE